MKERGDLLSEDISSINNAELEKELLENQSMNIIYRKDTNDGLKEIRDLYKGLNKSNKIEKETIFIKQNNEIINNMKHDKNSKEQVFEKAFLYFIDNEKIKEIIQSINENLENILSISFEDMNIIQRCSFFNKFKSLDTIFKQILEKTKNNEKILKLINNKNKRGYNALHYSVIRGNYEIYNYLIKQGADITIQTNSGYDILILACQYKRTYIFIEIIKNKIIKQKLNFEVLFDIKDKNNATLLHWSAFSDYIFGVRFILNHFKKDKNNFKFINYINYKDNNNMTALQYALMNNSKNVIFELALLENLELNSQDNEGRTCYDYSKAMNNKVFYSIIKMKNYKSNIIKGIIFFLLLIIFNILVYFIIMPIINIYYLKIIQLSLNLILIIILVFVKCIINPGLKKGSSEEFNNFMFKINKNEICSITNEINKYCLYCSIKREKSEIKHCPLCDCCVENFLKHDIFLNKCIGAKNFWLFIIYKIIFLIYFLYFIVIGFFIIMIDINENDEVTIPLIDLSFFYDKNKIIICSIIVTFFLIIILIFRIGDFLILLYRNKELLIQ